MTRNLFKTLILSFSVFAHFTNAQTDSNGNSYATTYGVPKEIVGDIYKHSFKASISMRNFSQNKIDSLCKKIKFGIPYKLYLLDNVPSCTDIISKPYTFFCKPEYIWCIPVLNSEARNPVQKYHRVNVLNTSGAQEKVWMFKETEYDSSQSRVVNYWFPIRKRIPVFISLYPHKVNMIYTIPGLDDQIFRFIPKLSDQISDQDSIYDTPCQMFDKIRDMIKNEIQVPRPYSPVAKLPDCYKDYNKKKH